MDDPLAPEQALWWASLGRPNRTEVPKGINEGGFTVGCDRSEFFSLPDDHDPVGSPA